MKRIVGLLLFEINSFSSFVVGKMGSLVNDFFSFFWEKAIGIEEKELLLTSRIKFKCFY